MLHRPPGTLRASGRAMRRAVPLALLLWASPAAADHDHDHDPVSDPDSDPDHDHDTRSENSSSLEFSGRVDEHAEGTRSQPQGFAFGSYGRVVAGSDLRGSSPEPVNVVAHGARVVEPSYLELDLYYRMRAPRGVDVTTVTTIAFGDSLFHATGTFDARVALRNLYLLAEKDLACGRLGLWAGSRMLRGDDIYLLDYWPLDDVNTVGAGATFASGRLETGVHAGLNRLLDPYQFQEREVFTPEEGTETIPELDRQRFIGTVQAAYRFLGTGAPDDLSARAKLYAEAQALPSGTRRMEDDSVERLPTDAGLSLGAQLALWGFAPGASHASLFARHSRGLTAYDELDTPMDLNADRKSYPDASETVLGLGGNVEQPWGGALLGAYARRFTDGDPSASDPDDGWEYALDARPRARVLADLEAAVDLSWQVRFPRGLSPTTLSAADPAVFQVAPMLLYSPFGPGSYARPQLRLVYRAAHLNPAARDQLYALEDPRRTLTWVHFLGVQAEWWFNSSTYRR